MINKLYIFKKEKKVNILGIILISILPLATLTGSAVLNFLILFINFFFLFLIFNEKKINFLKNKYFYTLSLFWTTLLLNSLLSSDILNSLERAFGFLRFFVLVFAISYFLNFKKSKYKKKILLIWSLVFLIVTIDLIFESIFGFNLFGYRSYMPGRLAGFLNQELKIGYFYSGFSLIAISSYYYFSNKHNTTYIFIFLVLIVCFLIGERANFLKTLIMTAVFLFLFEREKLNKKLITLTVILIVAGLFINFNDKYKSRFWDQFINPLIHSKYSEYLLNSQYGAHYDTAKKIFQNNLLFGVGLKNFRNESKKTIYENKEFLETDSRWSTHPHQVHWEFLSETGLLGYSAFVGFFLFVIVTNIKSLIIRPNLYQLSALLFIFVSFLPLIPSGSFFTTYGATIFWINFAVMISHEKQ